MSGDNLTNKVTAAIAAMTSPNPINTLLSNFKAQMMLDPIVQMIFGSTGQNIFISEMPNLNQSILPGILLSFKGDTYMSSDTYYNGNIDLKIFLPVTITKTDYNALAAIGGIFQRFIGGPLNLFSGTNWVPGLIKIGFESEFDYQGLAEFDGFTCPLIQGTIPFVFDLNKLAIDMPGFDLRAPLNSGDVGTISAIDLTILKEDDETVLIPEGQL